MRVYVLLFFLLLLPFSLFSMNRIEQEGTSDTIACKIAKQERLEKALLKNVLIADEEINDLTIIKFDFFDDLVKAKIRVEALEAKNRCFNSIGFFSGACLAVIFLRILF